MPNNLTQAERYKNAEVAAITAWVEAEKMRYYIVGVQTNSEEYEDFLEHHAQRKKALERLAPSLNLQT